MCCACACSCADGGCSSRRTQVLVSLVVMAVCGARQSGHGKCVCVCVVLRNLHTSIVWWCGVPGGDAAYGVARGVHKAGACASTRKAGAPLPASCALVLCSCPWRRCDPQCFCVPTPLGRAIVCARRLLAACVAGRLCVISHRLLRVNELKRFPYSLLVVSSPLPFPL